MLHEEVTNTPDDCYGIVRMVRTDNPITVIGCVRGFPMVLGPQASRSSWTDIIHQPRTPSLGRGETISPTPSHLFLGEASPDQLFCDFWEEKAGGWPTTRDDRMSGDALSLVVANPGKVISPGVHLPCYGPFIPPPGALSLNKMLPKVNMDIVHHMIMFGGRGRQAQVKPSDTHLCYSGEIVYAWARTGQAKPIGLDFADTPVKGDGFEVGPRSRFEWLAIQIHYQQLGSTDVLDQSGVELTFGPAKPQRPLAVTLMASWSLKIPPQIKTDECVQCRVVSGGTAVAWRNHAHRLARDVYSEHYGFNGEPKSHVGLISAQQPQVRAAPSARRLRGRGAAPPVPRHTSLRRSRAASPRDRRPCCDLRSSSRASHRTRVRASPPRRSSASCRPAWPFHRATRCCSTASTTPRESTRRPSSAWTSARARCATSTSWPPPI